jgi:hypothetical protein
MYRVPRPAVSRYHTSSESKQHPPHLSHISTAKPAKKTKAKALGKTPLLTLDQSHPNDGHLGCYTANSRQYTAGFERWFYFANKGL